MAKSIWSGTLTFEHVDNFRARHRESAESNDRQRRLRDAQPAAALRKETLVINDAARHRTTAGMAAKTASGCGIWTDPVIFRT